MGKLTFGATGLSYQVERPEMKVGGAPSCPRCTKRVYFNEERKLLGKSWHKGCFNCASCHKTLDSTNMSTHESEIYCNACHRKSFGIKGYGYAGGAAGLSTSTTAHDINRRPSSGRSSVSSAKQSDVTSSSRRNDVSTTNAALRQLSQRPNSTVFRAPQLDFEHPENCPRCGKVVYFVEEVKAMKRKWHKLCFKCAGCRKSLEAGKVEGHGGDIYCNNCYARHFGPKAHGYASSMIAAEPNRHFHVKSKNTSSELRVNGSTSSTSSTPLSPLSPKMPASLDSTASSSIESSALADHDPNMYESTAAATGEYNYHNSGQGEGDWSEEQILRELAQFEQVM